MAEEKLADAENNNVEVGETACFQASRNGQQFNPQPSNDPADPMNWPLALKVQYRTRMFEAWVKHLLILPKVGVLVQVCLLAAVGPLNTAIINPAYVPMAQEFGISTVRASYQT